MNVDLNQLRLLARKLSIPAPSAETISEILKGEGTMLVRQLEEAGKGNQRAAGYIRGVFLACHESTTDRLQRGKMAKPSIETMVAIGKSEGAAFGQRVKEWETAGFLNGDDSRYIRLTLARFLEQEATRRATPTDQATATQRNAQPTAVAIPNAMNYRPGRGAPAAPAATSQAAAQHVEAAANPDFPPATDDARDDYGRAQQERRYESGGSQQTATRSTRPEHQHRSRQASGERATEGRDVAPAAGAADPESAGEQTYLSQHIYGGRAAACFSADQTRGKVHTVRLEAAESSAARQYDWQRKIAIQLSQRELPLVLAVFMGWLPKFEGKGHGENNSKWFTLENQGNKLFLSVNAKGQSPRAVPIMPGDGYAVTTLLMRQMLKNDPFLSPEILLSLVRKEAALAGGQAHAPTQRAAA